MRLIKNKDKDKKSATSLLVGGFLSIMSIVYKGKILCLSCML